VPRQRLRKRLATVAFSMSLLLLIAGYAAVLTVFFLDLDVASKLPF
jgi:hypothetical protein